MRPGSLARRVVVGPAVTALLPRAGWVLDLGGYDGAVGELAARLGPKVVVADLDVGGLRTAQGRGLHAVGASATAVPFPAGCFDAVFCCDVLSALPEAATEELAMQEIRRLLKPGGYLFLTSADRSFQVPFAPREQAYQAWHSRYGPTWARLADLLAAAGLRLVERRGYYGLLTRIFYGVCFYRNLPSRGTRLKRRLFSTLVAAERWFCLRPQAHFVVARAAPDAAAAA